MWPVKEPRVELPLGFRLMEDEDRVSLFFGEKEVAKFPHGATPETIGKAAKDYLQVNP